LTWLMYFISLSFHLYQPLSSHFICITAYVSTQCLGISLHRFSFGWLAFAGTLNLLTHFTLHLSQLYIFVFVNNHIILHHHHVRQLLLFLLLLTVVCNVQESGCSHTEESIAYDIHRIDDSDSVNNGTFE